MSQSGRIEVVFEMPFTDKMPKQMMEECLRYYVMEYHVDGFVLNPLVAPMEGILAGEYRFWEHRRL